MKPSKTSILSGLIAKFEHELNNLIQSAKSAHLAATHEESKAEDKHDTFAIEASYLAAGQAVRVEELEKTLLEFKGYLEGTSLSTRASLGSVMQFKNEGKIQTVFLALLGGGTRIDIEGVMVQVVSVRSPLGESLIDTQSGESVDVEIRGTEKTYQVISIW